MRMEIRTDLDRYVHLKTCLSECCPSAAVRLISQDPVLKQIGLADKIPCVLEVEITWAQIEEIRNQIIGWEVSSPDEQGAYMENSESYQKYQRYGWLFDFLPWP